MFAEHVRGEGSMTHAVPALHLHAETGLPGEAFTALMQQYAARSPVAPLADEEVAAWAAALRQEALGAAAALRRAVEARRAAAGAADNAAAAEPPSRLDSEPPSQEGGSPGRSKGGRAAPGAVATAANHLDGALAQLEAALAGGPLDAAVATTLQRCAARLDQLLAVRTGA